MKSILGLEWSKISSYYLCLLKLDPYIRYYVAINADICIYFMT